MATRTVVCPECAEPLPYGRLSCPSCGTLLASVAGASRRWAVPEASSASASAAVPAEAPIEAVPDSALPEHQPEAPDEPLRDGGAGGEAADAHEAWDTEPDSEVVSHPDPLAAHPEPEAEPGPHWPTERPSTPPAAPPAAPTPPEPPVLREWVPPPEPSWPAPPIDDAVPPRHVAAASATPYEPAGAYLPPSAVFAPPEPTGAHAAPRTAERRPGVAPLLADLPFDAPDDLGDWLVTAGAGMAAVGFLLPWAPQLIGSAGVGGYLDRWGLGAAMNLPVFVLALGVLLLALVPNRLPGWLRAGVLPILLAGLLLGLVWPYLVGPFRADLGAMAEAIGAVLLAIGGVIAVRPQRHDSGPPTV